MILHVHIVNYKCLDHADFEFKPLTIITGLNSTGKSTLVQSVLLPQYNYIKSLGLGISFDFDTIRCKTKNSDNVIVSIDDSSIDISKENKKTLNGVVMNVYGRELFYLKADRQIDNRVSAVAFDSEQLDLANGLNAFVVFDMEKSEPLAQELIRYEESYTLQSQVNYWLSRITGQTLELTTEKDSSETVSIKYKSNGIPNISPSNLGTGVTYLAEILITCLRTKKALDEDKESDKVVLIENPEIHLHPKAQARLGEFLAFIASAGIQVIVETHCEHLINYVQYEVYEHRLHHEDVVIYYKSAYDKPFEEILLRKGGRFSVDFPEGFFDATLDELVKMS